MSVQDARRGAERSAAPSHLLRVADLSRAQLHALLDLAGEMADEPASWTRRHPRTAIACLFEASLAATRISFEAAAHRLGILPMVLGPGELDLRPGDPLLDTARLLSGHAAAIVVGTPLQTTLEELADAATGPVINGGTDEHQPFQSLADLLTLRRPLGDHAANRLATAQALLHVVVTGGWER